MSQFQNTRILDAASLLSLAEIAERWRCRYNAVHRRLRQARIPVVALGPGTLRVRASELLKAEKNDA